MNSGTKNLYDNDNALRENLLKVDGAGLAAPSAANSTSNFQPNRSQEEAAAIVIQKHARGMLARRASSRSSDQLGATSTDPVAVATAADTDTVPAATATSNSEGSETSQEEAAAIVIQKHARGMLARRASSRSSDQLGATSTDPVAVATAADTDTVPAATATSNSEGSETSQEEAAAVVIQKHARGKLARRASSRSSDQLGATSTDPVAVATAADTDTVPAATATSNSEGSETSQEEAAAIVIQKHARGMLARRASSRSSDQLGATSTDPVAVATAADTDTVPAATATSNSEGSETSQEEAAAIVIQKHARGMLARRASSREQRPARRYQHRSSGSGNSC